MCPVPPTARRRGHRRKVSDIRWGGVGWAAGEGVPMVVGRGHRFRHYPSSLAHDERVQHEQQEKSGRVREEDEGPADPEECARPPAREGEGGATTGCGGVAEGGIAVSGTTLARWGREKWGGRGGAGGRRPCWLMQSAHGAEGGASCPPPSGLAPLTSWRWSPPWPNLQTGTPPSRPSPAPCRRWRLSEYTASPRAAPAVAASAAGC